MPGLMLLPTNVIHAQSPPTTKQTVFQSVGVDTQVTIASDWPQFRGPAGIGISHDTAPPVKWSATQNIAWKVELPGAGASSPIIVGDRVFVTCYSGYGVPHEQSADIAQLARHLICLDFKSGEILWNKQVGTRLPEPETIRDHGYAANTPVADRERVFAFFGKSGLFAFDQNGRELWNADVGEGTSGWGTAASPILFGNLVIVNASVESESLIAFDQVTGKEVWRAGGIKESWSTPLLVLMGAKTELVVPVFGKLLGFDPQSGEQLWFCNTDIGWYMVPALVAHDEVVYCIGGKSGGALAVRAGGRGDVTETHRLWTGRKGSNVSSPVYHDGCLYWMHDNLGIAYCADAKTGEIRYEERIDRSGQVYASPVIVDGKIYYASRHAGVFVVAAQPKFELLARNNLDDQSTFDASFAVSNGQLLLRSDRYLYCIGGK
jgi:outer membrane protein assembly factor BamB